MRRQRPKTLLACGIVVALAFSISNARVAHAQWYYQAAKYIGIGVGTIITLWEATSEACSIYEGNTNNPSGRTLAACRRAGANKNSLPDQLDAIRALPKAQRDDAIRRAYLESGYSMASIARRAKLHYSTVSKIIKGVR